jgi:hypothetical protein
MRKAILRHAPLIAAGALLGACTHSVDLVPLDGGRAGIGDVGFRGQGMRVRLEGKSYAGRFVSTDTPAISMGMAPTAGAPIATGRHFGVQGVRGGQGAILRAKDGAAITCRFSYDPPDFIGSGLCRGQDGRNYALRMR